MRDGQSILGTSWDLVKLSAAVTEIKIIAMIYPAASVWESKEIKLGGFFFYLYLSLSELCPWPIAAFHFSYFFPPVTLLMAQRGFRHMYCSAMIIFQSRNCSTTAGRRILPAERLQTTRLSWPVLNPP